MSWERITVERGHNALPGPNGERFAELFRHGTLEVEFYAPRGTDPQQPHEKDEVYIIISGTGTYICGDERTPFEPNEVLFAPAGVVHRFEDFSDDFATWVIFYGSKGGEQPG